MKTVIYFCIGILLVAGAVGGLESYEPDDVITVLGYLGAVCFGFLLMLKSVDGFTKNN